MRVETVIASAQTVADRLTGSTKMLTQKGFDHLNEKVLSILAHSIPITDDERSGKILCDLLMIGIERKIERKDLNEILSKEDVHVQEGEMEEVLKRVHQAIKQTDQTLIQQITKPSFIRALQK